MTRVPTFPSCNEVTKSEAFPTAIWRLDPEKEGMLAVAAGRGGPFNLHWEVHGHGPVKLILISGLGVLKSAWQRQTLHFGHIKGDEYSVLLVDNWGMGRSDKPLLRYSTSAMASDLLEVLDHLSWTGERQVHVCGISMGGMIAQEMAHAAPDRIASLNLISTAAFIENTTSFSENMINRVTMLLPKSLDRTISYTATNLFPLSWLSSPDDDVDPLPDASTPFCSPPYPTRFSSNYARFAAQEITKQRDATSFSRTGFLMQLVAAGWHRKNADQLKRIGDAVGRERILVLHGEDDRVISVPHAWKLIRWLGLGPERAIVVPGLGHAPIAQMPQYFNDLLAKSCARGEALNQR
ncbi:Alpha/Beta hydrolase protein [Xylariaceae sp. FL0594]|nr:Alpha/Beta hydrolase protein [Xylariaceae sp. FL0594]